MKKTLALVSICLPMALIATPLTSLAHDRHHHHHHHKREHKEEYWDGQCKVERKWKSNGEYKEKRKCRSRPAAYHVPQPVYMAPPQPVYVAPQPQGLVIDSRIVLRP
ncbi:membrane lipoprotein, cell wall extensin motif protein [Comamonas testosteroni TK102]|uniref:Membrane lipoprotein, cell wall extensin motif protein n=1 Tax=Comamonas testosteroni TK102 TaxID=1392005 RepID=A0A076PVH8_COMTE|nr:MULTISPECIES: hypothetical protein [Comamonas]AIJ47815.1 membrane lipoprotein, cell wall extensin motif protein [Comamonas testosteroni TK102]MPS91799.1 hypothetical protein [Comamonas sp.]